MRTHRHAWLLNTTATTLASVLVSTPVRAEFETPTAILGVKIVTGTGGVIDSGTILIDHGRIVDLGADLVVPPHANRVDATGLIAYPGWIDAHVHLGLPKTKRSTAERERVEDLRPDPGQGPLPATRMANRRGIRPEDRAMESYAPTEDALATHRAAGFTAALVAPRDGLFGGTSDLVQLSDTPIRRSVLAPAVAQHGSYDPGEDGDYPRTVLGIFAQFRQVLLDARWYARVQKYEQRHPTRTDRTPVDPALDALQPLLGRRQRLIFEADSQREIRRALDLADEFNLDIAISGAREAWKVLDRIKTSRVPLVVSVKFDDEPEYGKKKTTTKGPDARKPDAPDTGAETGQAPKESLSDKEKDEEKIYEPLKVRKEKRRLWEEHVSNLVRLHEAGVPFALRTRDFDSPADFWKNIRMVMERGLPEDAVIAALTRIPAEWFGVADQLGALRPGALANITIGDKPLPDDKSEVRYVFIDGREFKIDKDKKTGGKSARARRGTGHAPDRDQTPTADAAEESEHDESAEESAAEATDEEDKGPTFASEIRADRIPPIRTGGNVLIRNATLIPVAAPTLTNASILVRSGKIAAIGTIDNVPPNVTVIDGAGRFVIPGFVDCHSHLGIDAANEGTLSISAEVRIADVINPDNDGIFRAVAGGTTTHHVMHGSANPIGGQNAVLKLKYDRPASEMHLADAPPTIKFALGENVTRSNSSRGENNRFPGSRMGVEAVIRDALHHASAYQREWDAFERASRAGEDLTPPRRDLRLEALANVLTGDFAVHAHCYRSDEILRLMHVAEDFGFRIAALQHVLEGYRIAPEIARHGAGASTFADMWAYKIEAYGAIPHNASLMTEHGINVSVNSDSPNRIRYLGLEAAKCIKWGGLSETEALQLVTLNPATQLRIDHRIGSIEIGKDADLAVFNGHPLNTFSKCILTLIDGEAYFLDPRPEPNEPADKLHLPPDVDMTIPETPHRAYAIVGATIHTIFGPVIRNGTVVIVDDTIHDVGVNVTIPPGAGVIDAKGLHVLPALIDAGSQLGLTEIGALRQTRDYSDIARFSPELHAASAIHPHSEHIRIARTAGIGTTLAVPSGGIISGQSCLIHLDGWTVDEMLFESDLALHLSVPTLPERFRGGESRRKEFEKRVEEDTKKLHQFMQRAAHYARVKAIAAEHPNVAFEADRELEAMVPYIRGEKRVVLHADGYKNIVETLEFAEKHKLKWILGGGRESWKVAEKLAEKNIPVILGSPLTYPRGEFEPWDSVYRCAGDLSRAGVRFCFASGDASSAYDLALDAGMAVAHGLPADRAEHALTLGAADILGIADRVGTIEVGKRADIIVSTDTPLQATSRVTHMFLAGRPIELTSMHTESYEKFKNRPEPALPPPPDLRGPNSLTGK
jgi:imidazolonepropionase-like amidohydrolase